ncbi:MAG: SpoIIE family protein phosphatase [Leptospiraceae bacterium]|nr:SpoIIE family protein phosphatase [Leptospiraceae bacterium]MDW7975952.1 SpoIIE family protein phosphatase [Leptospiraceae bacterium]
MIELKYGKRKVLNYRGSRIVVGGLTAQNKIDILLYISKELATSNDEITLYNKVLNLITEIFEPDNSTLRIFDGQYLNPVAFLNENTGKRRPLLPGEGFSGAVFLEGKSKLILDLKFHPEFLDRFETTRCVLCAPISHNEEKLGTISIEKTIPHFYRHEDLEILEAMASQIALALIKVRLIKKIIEEKQRIQKIQNQLEWDLKMGRTVQEQIINTQIKPWNSVYFHIHYTPMVEVSGDYFHIHRTKEHVTIFIADVSGHGVPAALVTISIHHYLKNCLERGLGLIETIEELQTYIAPILPEGVYFTAQIIRIYSDHTYSYVNAGHPKFLHFSYEKKEFYERDTTGIPLGFSFKFHKNQYEEFVNELKPGDFLILFTDGIIEQRNPSEEEVGLPRLKSWFLEAIQNKEHNKDSDGRNVLTFIMNQWNDFVRHHRKTDDRTLILIEYLNNFEEIKSLQKKAFEFYKRKDYSQAEVIAKTVFDMDPSYGNNLLVLTKLSIIRKDWEKVIEYSSRYIQHTGDQNPDIYFYLGIGYFYNKNFTDAKKTLKKIITLRPEFYRAYIILSLCYIKEKHFFKAKKILQNALKIFPNDDKITKFLKKVESYEKATASFY